MKMRYFFQCKGCRSIEEVGEATFKEFAGDRWDGLIAAAEKENAAGAVITFEKSCPFCSREGKEEVEIGLLKEEQLPSVHNAGQRG